MPRLTLHDTSQHLPGQPVIGPWNRVAQARPALDSPLPAGWWLLPLAGLGLCMWTSLALALT